jgi:hypothetical protein
MTGKFLNTGMDGEPDGYTLHEIDQQPWGWLWTKTVYDWQLDVAHPVMFQHPDGRLIMTERHMLTDLGSIPPPLRSLPGCAADRFILPYCFHDGGYQDGGFWVSYDEGLTWIFEEWPRKDVDDLLHLMILCDPRPGTGAQADIIWSQVRMWGWLCDYGKGEPPRFMPYRYAMKRAKELADKLFRDSDK